ncbi:MAG: hypothetical protein ISS23_02450 [Nanoarchaeota archaeon]|nr:hypothetical protein [Nanoarchaeota archaeon]
MATIWIIRALIIIAGILAIIRLNKITSILKKKYPKLYKELDEPGLFTLNFKKGFIAVLNLEKKIILKDKSLPKEIHKLAKHLRIGLIIALVLSIILLITLVILLVQISI